MDAAPLQPNYPSFQSQYHIIDDQAHQQRTINYLVLNFWKMGKECQRQDNRSRAGQWRWGTDATSCCWGWCTLVRRWPPWWGGRHSECCRRRKWCHWTQQTHRGPVAASSKFKVNKLDNSDGMIDSTSGIKKDRWQRHIEKRGLQHFVRVQCTRLHQMHSHDMLGPCKLGQYISHQQEHQCLWNAS
jgi:hypothetical protein